jgi:hypothetical protein
MEMYHFVTEWFFRVPIEKVWNEIDDWESWSTWWQDCAGSPERWNSGHMPLGRGNHQPGLQSLRKIFFFQSHDGEEPQRSDVQRLSRPRC